MEDEEVDEAAGIQGTARVQLRYTYLTPGIGLVLLTHGAPILRLLRNSHVNSPLYMLLIKSDQCMCNA